MNIMMLKTSVLMNKIDTITAIATPSGHGSVGIIRTSGPLVKKVANMVLGKLPQARRAEYLAFLDEKGNTLDQGIAIFFPSPHSFTGEDVLELQGHNSPVILDLLLQHIISIPNVRIARPGEFSERAFFNKKLNLTQVEAIADIINVSSKQAARSAVNSLQGVFSKQIYKLVKMVTNLRIHIEASINFSNEEVHSISKDKIKTSLDKIITKINKITIKAQQGNLLREGIKVIISGKPNVGKSSLLNVLTGHETAIVTSIPGTTRDLLHEYINLDGIPIHIIDTAGLHETKDEVELIGIKRTCYEIKQANHILLIVDCTTTSINDIDTILSEFIKNLSSNIPITIIRNKADLTGENISINKKMGYSIITLSAKYDKGINLLRDHLKKSINFDSSSVEGIFLARRRHLDALKNAALYLHQGKKKLTSNYTEELLAEDLKLAQQSLSEITGEFNSNKLLNMIFSNFCVGK